AQAGGSGMSFLKLGTSAQGIAMADAMSAHVTGSAATYYNPAGLQPVASHSGEILLMHKEWIQDTRTEVLSAAAALSPSQALGLSINSTSVSDIEIRTRPGLPDGTFTSRNYAIGLTYAHRFSDHVVAGVTAKYLYEKILVDDASGLGFDIGVQYRPLVDGLSFGAVAANIGSMSALKTESSTLPTTLKLGGAFQGRLESLSSDFTLASDLQFITPASQTLLAVGGELLFEEAVAARAGYLFGSEGRGFSAGLGVRHGIVGFDYAYAPLTSELGSTHTFSLFVLL
ncbi:MAG: PorV/PorQ family protein, partial [Ignavibacteria bacterium]|nr:PorV/PorQ family protein [Ignavibacteria bacterium]